MVIDSVVIDSEIIDLTLHRIFKLLLTSNAALVAAAHYKYLPTSLHPNLHATS